MNNSTDVCQTPIISGLYLSCVPIYDRQLARNDMEFSITLDIHTNVQGQRIGGKDHQNVMHHHKI